MGSGDGLLLIEHTRHCGGGPGSAWNDPVNEGAITPASSLGLDVDKPILMKENARLRPFQTQILECRIKPLIGESTHVMVTPLRAGESQPGGTWPLPPGLHVLHTYTRLKMGSSRVSMVVRNMSESPIFLKKGVQVAQVVSASPVPSTELCPGMEAALGVEATQEPMSVTTQQEKLLEKPNLDGLSNWTPWNTAAALDLVLAFHNIFTLEGNELVLVQSSMRSALPIVSHLRSDSDAYPHRFWRRWAPCSRIC